MEVLSPTKNLQTAKVAIQNGADALYFASPSFGARTNASIGIEEIIEIINYASLYDVRTYITFNTVIFDNEIEKFFTEINKIYQGGASGVILQDFALLELIKQNFPELEVHASTQMHVHNSDGVKFLQSLGANRVVVPREMNFRRIRKIKDETNVDIEAFIHGAICVSYSGQCYDSTLLDQKSANRGRCSQYCRMPQYIVNTRTDSVVSTGKYPLNLKDMNNLENVDKYIEAGVDSLKIEGRLKQFDYVGLNTRAYREAIDYYEGKVANRLISSDDLTNVYNRQFTTGRINSKNGGELVNLYKPNNTGHYMGTVVDVVENNNRDLGFYSYLITIDSDEVLNHQDNIRFINQKFEDGQVVEKIESVVGSKITVYSKVKPPVGCDVYRTQDHQLISEFERQAQKFGRRNEIELDLRVNDKKILYQIGGSELKDSGLVMEPALKQAITKEKFLKKLQKTNDTPFDFKIGTFDYNEDLFIPMGSIGKLKQMIIQDLEDMKLQKRSEVEVKLPEVEFTNENKEVKYFVEVRTLEQYQIVKKYSDLEVLIGDIYLCDEIAYDENDRLVLPRINYDDELEYIDQLVERYSKLCISELGTLTRYDLSDKDVITNFTLNVTNRYTLHKLQTMGINRALTSIELNHDKLEQLDSNNAIVNIYGRVPVMIMDYCPINHNKQDTCGSCRRCHSANYVLEDEYDRIFPLMYEGNARIGMYSQAPVCLFDKQEELQNVNIKLMHLRFTNESKQKVADVLSYMYAEETIENDFIRGSYYKETL